MKVLIICEGSDDAYIVADYINKINENKWEYTKESFEGFSVDKKDQLLTRYVNNDNKSDTFITYSVGGKTNFKKCIKTVIEACEKSNEDTQLFDEIVVLMDKDNESIDEKIVEISTYFSKWNVTLKDRKRCDITYITEFENQFSIKITPIIVPLEGNGAIETAIRHGIANIDDEHKYIVEESEQFITDISEEKNVTKYLQKEREIEKAKFSAVISVMSPERSLNDFKFLFDASNWSNTENVKLEFGVIDDIFN